LSHERHEGKLWRKEKVKGKKKRNVMLKASSRLGPHSKVVVLNNPGGSLRDDKPEDWNLVPSFSFLEPLAFWPHQNLLFPIHLAKIIGLAAERIT
jgi:hypothetical protein